MISKGTINNKIIEPGLIDKKILVNDVYEIIDLPEDETDADIRVIKKIKKSKKNVTGTVAGAFTSDPVKMYLPQLDGLSVPSFS